MDPLFKMMASSGSSQASDPYNINNASFDSSVTNSNFPSGVRGFTVAGNGSKFYVMTATYQNSTVHQFSLSTAWDFSSTISLDGSYTSGIDWGQKLVWKNDGSRLYYVNHDEDRIYQWDKSTNWDYNSSTTASSITSFSSFEGTLTDVAFSSNGSKLFIYGNTRKVQTWDLATAWDAASTRSNYDASSALSNTLGTMDMSPDGVNFYFCSDGGTVEQRVATTAYDVSTIPVSATYTLDLSSDTSHSNPVGRNVAFNTDGTKMFVWESGEPRILIYTL